MAYFLCNFQGFPLLWAASAKMLKSCNFHAFPTAGKPHFYDFIALRGPNPVSFVHCQGFLRNLSMSLHTNRWHMAYFLCNFLCFPLLWAASAKMLKKLQFPCFSHCSKASLLWFHCAKGTKPSFFRPLPRFPAEFEHVTTHKQMAYGLFSLQFSRFSFALGGFCHFLPFNGFLCKFRSFPLLWAASAKNAEKVGILSMSLIKADGTWFIFPAHFICSFALDGFCQTAEKVAISILSMGFFAIFLFLLCVGALHLGQLLKKLQFRCFSHCRKASFLWFHCAKGSKPSFFRPLPRFPAEFEHVTTYKQMAYGLFSLQFSRFSFALGGFCHFLPFNGFLCNFLCFPLLWAASAKNAEKVVISRFPSDFEHVTNKST